VVSRTVIGGEVPRKDALGDEVAPAEVAVAALPGVTKGAHVRGDIGMPAEMNHADGGGRGCKREHQSVSPNPALDGDVSARPLTARSLKGDPVG